jgi:predicted nucleic acid-binding protein
MSRVYLETSYVSACVTDRTDTDSLYRLKHSHEWWDSQRQLHDLYVSPEVIAELSVESYRRKDQALAWISGIPLLEINDDVLGLARVLIHEKAMPSGSGDPIHVAVAAVHGIQYMVSWNVKHLANVNKREHLARICARCGYIAPEILTPDVFWESES